MNFVRDWDSSVLVSGVTTVLTMTTMGFGGRAQMPRVSYATALDSFVIICFSFVFAVMIEYAVINFFDKIAGDMKKLLQDRGVKKKVREWHRICIVCLSSLEFLHYFLYPFMFLISCFPLFLPVTSFVHLLRTFLIQPLSDRNLVPR